MLIKKRVLLKIKEKDYDWIKENNTYYIDLNGITLTIIYETRNPSKNGYTFKFLNRVNATIYEDLADCKRSAIKHLNSYLQGCIELLQKYK